jgi:hypothetical protein
MTDTPITEGKLYLSKGRLRVDLGPMVDVYIVEKKKGWRMFPNSGNMATLESSRSRHFCGT